MKLVACATGNTMFALSDEIRDCYKRASKCAQEAAAQSDPTLKLSLLQTARRWLAMARRQRAAVTGVPEVRERWWRVAVSLQIDDGLLANSRALIAESKRLLATLQFPPVPATTTRQNIGSETTEGGSDPRQQLSVRVFEKGSVFGWTLASTANEILGRGTAETELKARIDAFRAGMIYIDRSKSRSTADGIRFH